MSAKGMKEANVQALIMMALSDAGCLVWRQNTGVLPDRNGRLLRFGVCVGSSDIVGICEDGKFLAIEVKTALGQPTDAQLNFIRAVQRQGGRAGIARSAAEAVEIACKP